MGKFQRRLLISAGICIAADTMEVLLLSFLTLVVTREWNLSHAQASAVTSIVFVGEYYKRGWWSTGSSGKIDSSVTQIVSCP